MMTFEQFANALPATEFRARQFFGL